MSNSGQQGPAGPSREVSLEGELTSSSDGRANRQREWRRRWSRRAIACDGMQVPLGRLTRLALNLEKNT